MKIKYSQKWTKTLLDKRIKKLLKYIPLTTPGVLLKVFCYTRNVDPDYYFRGHYRYTRVHGLYQNKIKMPNIPKHIITLKFHPNISNEKLLYFLAHELGHYKDWRKYKGKKYKCAQKRCDKFAYKCIDRMKVLTKQEG